MSEEQNNVSAEIPVVASNAQRPFFKRRWVLVLLIVLASFIVLVLLLDNVVMPLYVNEGSVATVPNVVGATTDAAQQTLKTAGYEPIQYENRFDDKAPDRNYHSANARRRRRNETRAQSLSYYFGRQGNGKRSRSARKIPARCQDAHDKIEYVHWQSKLRVCG